MKREMTVQQTETKKTSGVGSRVVGPGFAAALLLAIAFWGTFAWAAWTNNWALLEPLIYIVAVVAGVGGVVAFAADLYKKLTRVR